VNNIIFFRRSLSDFAFFLPLTFLFTQICQSLHHRCLCDVFSFPFTLIQAPEDMVSVTPYEPADSAYEAALRQKLEGLSAEKLHKMFEKTYANGPAIAAKRKRLFL